MWLIPSEDIYKHKGTPTTWADFLSSNGGGGDGGHAHSEIRVKTTSCALSPPRKYLGEAGWGEAGDTTGPPQKILE